MKNDVFQRRIGENSDSNNDSDILDGKNTKKLN